jgi:hypothetical protein
VECARVSGIVRLGLGNLGNEMSDMSRMSTTCNPGDLGAKLIHGEGRGECLARS